MTNVFVVFLLKVKSVLKASVLPLEARLAISERKIYKE